MNLIKALESNKRYREVDDKSSCWRDPTEQILFTREAVLADYEIEEEYFRLTGDQIDKALLEAYNLGLGHKVKIDDGLISRLKKFI